MPAFQSQLYRRGGVSNLRAFLAVKSTSIEPISSGLQSVAWEGSPSPAGGGKYETGERVRSTSLATRQKVAHLERSLPTPREGPESSGFLLKLTQPPWRKNHDGSFVFIKALSRFSEPVKLGITCHSSLHGQACFARSLKTPIRRIIFSFFPRPKETCLLREQARRHHLRCSLAWRKNERHLEDWG